MNAPEIVRTTDGRTWTRRSSPFPRTYAHYYVSGRRVAVLLVRESGVRFVWQGKRLEMTA